MAEYYKSKYAGSRNFLQIKSVKSRVQVERDGKRATPNKCPGRLSDEREVFRVVLSKPCSSGAVLVLVALDVILSSELGKFFFHHLCSGDGSGLQSLDSVRHGGKLWQRSQP
eukprot:CAMPEP_0196599340 /NCGR_PEP_ID=MMETSP1081-20130531/94806_1 /TAXON_ID=36882 /ORGANISM="Pyramimonas amylifera, Strain CCMP720" /LENGTH=111 /DNA_ID=CAMNT_0041925105 /DNA_START=758 /DNA_END=1093 /DNA_ORIENTATION=-